MKIRLQGRKNKQTLESGKVMGKWKKKTWTPGWISFKAQRNTAVGLLLFLGIEIMQERNFIEKKKGKDQQTFREDLKHELSEPYSSIQN